MIDIVQLTLWCLVAMAFTVAVWWVALGRRRP